ncbi:MAG: hypothetical protein QME66_00615 [Candidatus Eisenbacteria bacterium]|nr:hypothetical protein [Candidatus Eisenbacteria bacterium]
MSSRRASLVQETNRLYMLSVRHESLMNKRSAMALRLKEINEQLKGIETDIGATDKQYRKLQGNSSHKRNSKRAQMSGRNNGRSVRAVPFKF